MKKQYDKGEVLKAANGRWKSIFLALAPSLKDAVSMNEKNPGRHVPCPVHGGVDGFRLFPHYQNTGSCICNSCGGRNNGFETLMWVNGWRFNECVNAVGAFLASGVPESVTDSCTKSLARPVKGQTGRLIAEGKLIAFGMCHYAGHDVFSIQLDVESESKIFYGTDLKRALDESAAALGDAIQLYSKGYRRFRSQDGKTTFRQTFWHIIKTDDSSSKKRRSIERLWELSKEIDLETDTPLTNYLEKRHIKAALQSVTGGESLRYMPTAFYPGAAGSNQESYPALIARVVDVNNQLVTLHRTFLSPSGNGKADVSNPKLLMSLPEGESVCGCSIRLGEIGQNGVLCLAEGIETAMSVIVQTGFPCWACLSANVLKTFVPPPEAKTIFIFVDKDASEVGQKAGYELKQRLKRLNIVCAVMEITTPIPEDSKGLDWNDVLIQKLEDFPL